VIYKHLNKEILKMNKKIKFNKMFNYEILINNKKKRLFLTLIVKKKDIKNQ
jgi:hypothetical protein